MGNNKTQSTKNKSSKNFQPPLSKNLTSRLANTPRSKNKLEILNRVQDDTQRAIRIEITPKITDTRAVVRLNKLNSLELENQITGVKIVDVYTIDKKFTIPEVNRIAESLSNPVTDYFSFEGPINLTGPSSQVPQDDRWAIEIGFLPGVTDNIGHTAKETIEDLLKGKGERGKRKEDWAVYSSQITFISEGKRLGLISGKLTESDAQKIADSLHNPLIQSVRIKNSKQFEVEKGMGITIPKVELEQTPQVTVVDLNVSDVELIKIGKEGIANPDGSRRGPLALDLTYMKTIQEYFKEKGRNPTDIELEALAQTWSEHCKHTIFNNPLDELKDGLFKTYIRGATEKIRGEGKGERGKQDFIAKVFDDNSGAIEFDDEYYITHKVETHNTPSALDPFGGAITGIVGVNRDALGFGLGAKPIFNTYGFMFADPSDEKPLYRDENLTRKMLLPRRIMEGVIAGVNAGGNQSGIPTPQGFLYFEPRYKGKPLVFVGTVGLIPKKVNGKSSIEKQALPGDLIVMLGGKVGMDGIHGATFSSETLDLKSPSTAVQIGDPITQKKFSDAIIREARDLGLYNSITDNGAGGLSSSVSEMARESLGCKVDLEKVPLKYPGLEPWQIWISESQERMTLSVPKNKWEKLKKLLESRGVDAWVIGEFTDSGKCEVDYRGRTILNIDMDFLHEGLPKEFQISNSKFQIKHKEPVIREAKDLTDTFIKMVGRLNICSYDFISTQFDHTVQALAVTYPVLGKGRVNSENAVVRPRLDSDERSSLSSKDKGLVLSQGLYPEYSDIDTYHMAASSIDTAFKNAIIAGADPEKIALLDNFCWCSSDEPERLYQLKQAAKACFDYAVAYRTPFISGKDSMFNDFKGFDSEGKPVKISIPPTLLISSIGIIRDIKKAVTLDSKIAGDLVYVLGGTFDEMGASEFYGYLSDTEGKKYIGNSIPKVDAQKNLKLYLAYSKALNYGLVSSAIGVNRGGIGVALSKTALGGMLGMEINLKGLPGKVSGDTKALYSESQGRILVTIDPKKKEKFEKIIGKNAYHQIGKITENPEVKIHGLDGNLIVDTDLEYLKQSYRERFKEW